MGSNLLLTKATNPRRPFAVTPCIFCLIMTAATDFHLAKNGFAMKPKKRFAVCTLEKHWETPAHLQQD
jgi:hypothetical protein